MPKLLVFAPCEKVIISQDENNPTLIAILSSLTLQADAESLEKALGENESPEAAMVLVPIRWSVFTMWQREESDGPREFTQTIDIESPDGKAIITHRNTFSFKPDAITHRITLQLPGFPVRKHGLYTVRLSLEGQSIAEYPLELKLQPASTSKEAATR